MVRISGGENRLHPRRYALSADTAKTEVATPGMQCPPVQILLQMNLQLFIGVSSLVSLFRFSFYTIP
jgi:hypothetical protein